MSKFEVAIHSVLEHEGYYSNDKFDPGGATKYGISLRFLKGIKEDINLDGEVNIEDIRALSVERAMELYKEHWWDKYRYSQIDNQELATKIFDLAINMGARQAHKLIQRACRATNNQIKDDGYLGEKSFYAIDKSNPEALLSALRSEAAGFYRAITAKNRNFKKFIKGWLNRAYS